MHIVSMSFGKDSTAMLEMMLEKKEPIHSAMWFDTEWEFPEIRKHAEKVIHNSGINLQVIRHWAGFDFLEKRYGAPHPSGGWCVGRKTQGCNRYMRLMVKDNPDIVECIGFTTDEMKRAERLSKNKDKKWPVRFPLIEWGISEKDALEYCYSKGYDFGGIYDWMPSKRVSCWKCPKQSKADWVAIRKHHPEFFTANKPLDPTQRAERLS